MFCPERSCESERIGRVEFEELLLPWLGKTADAVDRVLSESSMDASNLDAILFVGGSTRIPIVTRFIRDRYGIEPDRSLNPDFPPGQPHDGPLKTVIPEPVRDKQDSGGADAADIEKKIRRLWERMPDIENRHPEQSKNLKEVLSAAREAIRATPPETEKAEEAVEAVMDVLFDLGEFF